ncbi:MAG: hypothetical protein RSD94_08790 [Acinetobacter sp.]
MVTVFHTKERAIDRLNPRSLPLNIRLGGTTEELIDDKKDWDMAIVSSKDVNLQTLADEGLNYNAQTDDATFLICQDNIGKKKTVQDYPQCLQCRFCKNEP